MTRLGKILSVLLFASLSPALVEAQSWVSVAPAGEKFSVQMPENPLATPQKYRVGQFKVEGNVYSASSKGVTYFVWSLNNPAFADYKSTEGESYEDACADLVWDGLFKPWWNKLPKEQQAFSSLTWAKSLKWIRTMGTDYFLTISGTHGLVHIVVNADQLYVLAITNPAPSGDEVEHFINTFSLGVPRAWPAEEIASTPAETAAPGALGSTGPGKVEANAVTDYNRVFKGNEVDQRARLLTKPEPVYTQHARRYQVIGKVVLRAVFAGSGEVTNIKVIQPLPQGLTQQTILAARQIKFVPATKDGQPVSMDIQLEYNFNLY